MGILTKRQEKMLQGKVVEILTRSISRKMGGGVTFITSDEEDLFFRSLVKATLEAKLNPDNFYFEPMSDKSFSVQYSGYPIGRIKIRGRKTWMQILSGLYDVKTVENLDINEYVNYIPAWIKHIKYCLKS